MSVGPALLLAAACAFGVLEVHSSTDTWIALAAGREILTQPNFPETDRFSYTFYGVTWLNQNWVSHVLLWALYDWLGRSAVVIGTWAMGAGLFALVMLAVRMRSRSWLGACWGASAVAIACRDWLSARPATIQFFCLAALGLCLSALLSQGNRRRWWPIVLLLPLLGFWTHAHGSFVFGYGLVCLFLACGAAAWILGRPAAASPSQALVIIGVLAATLTAGMVLSPYGIQNYTHQFKVATSDVFRQVNEWIPPYRAPKFRGAWRFWAAVTVTTACPLLVWLLHALDPWIVRGQRSSHAGAWKPASGPGLCAAFFDAASVPIGLGMALFARRFAPIFYILAAPPVVGWTVHWGRSLSARLQTRLASTLMFGAWPAAIMMAVLTCTLARRDLIASYAPGEGYDLLDRVTQFDRIPGEALEFLRRNRLTPNLFTEWEVAGPVMFYVPGARVFIDGRAQQLFTEQHYLKYVWLMTFPDQEEPLVSALLDQCGTEAVLLRRSTPSEHLGSAVSRLPQWIPVFLSPKAVILARQGSSLMGELARRERIGDLWWPDLPETEITRGLLLVATQPEDVEGAVRLWRSGIARQPRLGLDGYRWISQALREAGRADDATAYLEAERGKLTREQKDLSDELRAALLEVIQRCQAAASLDSQPEPRAEH
jgi:hypothetical protein